MTYMSKLLSFDNPVFCGYLTYSSILIIKMMLMSILTGKERRKHLVPASPEDMVFFKDKQPNESHPDVDRVRRAHLNDVENIPLFFATAFGYLLTDPNPGTALNLFRIYTAARMMHTFVYAIYVVRPPARGISWAVGYLVTGFMAVSTIIHFGAF